jgi:hypothetical protein
LPGAHELLALQIRLERGERGGRQRRGSKEAVSFPVAEVPEESSSEPVYEAED